MLVFPNAKINIGLNVVEKRADGFHNIESIFYPVKELYDVLEVVPRDELQFENTGIDIPGDQTGNLCIKAYELIKKDFEIAPVHIHLHKVIPIGAGLGGGSADATFMLKSLNELFELRLTDDQLIEYAKKLGSDCPFFIKNQPVYAFNKGDEFEPVELDLSQYDIRVHYPDIHISTQEAYQSISPSPNAIELKNAIKKPIEKWQGLLKNDFENALEKKHPIIREEKEKMIQAGAKFAAMTGSGSAVYGIF